MQMKRGSFSTAVLYPDHFVQLYICQWYAAVGTLLPLGAAPTNAVENHTAMDRS